MRTVFRMRAILTHCCQAELYGAVALKFIETEVPELKTLWCSSSPSVQILVMTRNGWGISNDPVRLVWYVLPLHRETTRNETERVLWVGVWVRLRSGWCKSNREIIPKKGGSFTYV